MRLKSFLTYYFKNSQFSVKISSIFTMNIFNDITVHAASFKLESQLYFLDNFRQKRPLWQKEGEKMEEKKKKSFFPRENWRQDTIILVMNISFLVWTSQRNRNGICTARWRYDKAYLLHNIIALQAPCCILILFFAKIVCRITTFKAARPCIRNPKHL